MPLKAHKENRATVCNSQMHSYFYYYYYFEVRGKL